MPDGHVTGRFHRIPATARYHHHYQYQYPTFHTHSNQFDQTNEQTSSLFYSLFIKRLFNQINMSTITFRPTVYQSPISWDASREIKTMEVSTRQFVPVKPEIQLIVTPVHDDERLQRSRSVSTSSSMASTVREQAPTQSTSEEKHAAYCSPKEAMNSVVVPDAPLEKRVYLSKRERLSRWWQKEKAEQKAFRNAMSRYHAF